MQNHNVYEQAAQEWRRRGVSLLPPAPEAEVIRTFGDLGYPLSMDVLSLYTTVGGFVDYEWDGLWSFWSLRRLREESEGVRRPFVMFADWLICSHFFCFHYEGPGTSSVYISHNTRSLEADPVACSVPEFLERLLRNPDEVQAWDLSA